MSANLSSSEIETLVDQVMHGDHRALGILFHHHRQRLWRIVNFRLDQRLLGRVDADDILQESYLAAEKRLEHFLHDSPESFFIWLRLIVND